MYQLRFLDGDQPVHADVYSTIHARSSAERLSRKFNSPVHVYRKSHDGLKWEFNYTIENNALTS